LTQHISRSLGDCPVGAGKEDVRKPVVGLSRIPVSKYLFREVTLIKRLSRIIAAATHARMIQQDLTIGKAMRKRAQIGPASRRMLIQTASLIMQPSVCGGYFLTHGAIAVPNQA
jgi:hypothetical protein